MKKIFLFLALYFPLLAITAQNYSIGHVSINFTDITRSNRSIPTEIYYPSDIAGDGVAFTTLTTNSFPLLIFGHGFLASWDVYQNFWEELVPKGYIMVFPKTETTTSISHLEYAKDFSFLIDEMTNLGTHSNSIFYQKISPMNAVMGHSMGGGSSFLAVPLNQNIKTLVNFAATETVPSAIAITPSINIPTLIIGGTLDCITPPATNQFPLYNGVGSSCKTYINIIGATHCQMANANILCSSGELFCIPATISRNTQHTLIFKYLVPWLEYQLKGNCEQGNYFDTQIVIDPLLLYLKNCTLCNSMSTITETQLHKEIQVFPNPVYDLISFKGLQHTDYVLKIYDVLYQIKFENCFEEQKNIKVSKWSSGTYFYEITDSNGNRNYGKFIKM